MQIVNSIDTMWVLIAASLVFFMQAGFAFVEVGLHSAKNSLHILMKHTGSFVLGAIIFWAAGFAFMFGNGNEFIGLKGHFLRDAQNVFNSLNWALIPIEAKLFFQTAIAGVVAAIIGGSFGGRFKFFCSLSFTCIILAVVYPIIGHWVWGGGWLAIRKFSDIAGTSVIHQTAGWAALAGALLVGPRMKRFSKKTANPYPPHNMLSLALGIFIIWLGQFGISAGSLMSISSAATLISQVFLVTNLGGVAGGIFATLFGLYICKKWDANALFNGIIGGLVSVSSCSTYISPIDSIVVGGIGGCLVILATMFLEKIKVDDVVGAWPVHAVCGFWGTMALGLFAQGKIVGLFYGGGVIQLGIQFIGAIAIASFSLCSSLLILKLLDVMIGLRVSGREEVEGADLHEHGYGTFTGLELLPMNRRESDQALDEENDDNFKKAA